MEKQDRNSVAAQHNLTRSTKWLGKILLVEDDNDLRNMLEAFLEAHGFSIDAAQGVTAALELMESNGYDIMLIDKNMTGIDGNRKAALTC